VRTKGITFIELLIAVLIAGIAIGATLGCLSQSLYLSEIAFNTTIIIADIRDMFEEIWSTPFDSIVANFPDALADGPVTNNYAAIVGGYRLLSEQITVEYVNAVADPLEIFVTANWTDSRGRTHSIQLSTYRTRN